MTLSMYTASTPVFLRHFKATTAILDKAAAFCEAKKIAPDVLVNYRLAPDMLPFKNQIYVMGDMAKGCIARLAGVDVPSYADTESTFDELKARLAKTADFINGFPAAKIDGSETREIVMKIGPTMEMKFKGDEYLTGFVMPNFYFHTTTAYAILRHAGLEIGKRDFLGG